MKVIKISLCLIFLMLMISPVFSQVETIPADHPVYPFLKIMYMKGALRNYSDIILPLSKEKIVYYLTEVETRSYLLSESEREMLCRYQVKMGMISEKTASYFSKFPSGFAEDYKKYSEKHLYYYADSTASLNVDILGDLTYLYSEKLHDYSVL